ncbi:MAG: hypothetical protein ACRCW2_15975 [Cellulosilyticaceae bacterium]
MGNPCAFTPAEPQVFTFVAAIQVPVGYVITDPPIYATHLSLDSSTLHLDKEIQLKNSLIYVDDNDPSKTLSCTSKIYLLELEGPIYYNAVAERFSPSKNFDPEKYTAFSAASSINIEMPLGYSCYECDIFPTTPPYTVLITPGTEFIVTSDGSIIPHNPLDPDPFYNALKDPNASQTIQIPYTLTITPLPL